MKITLFTSGSTNEPKLVQHENILPYVERAVSEIGLTSKDRVLDIFPANVIAHYTVTAQPALAAGAHLISSNFDPYNYIKLFEQYCPTVIALIPRHIQVLSKTKGWAELDMSCVRYMVTGSQVVTMDMINSLRSKGVQTVANWYGLTELPPPVFVAYNSDIFNLTSTHHDIKFTDAGECVINGLATGDIFNLETKRFSHRKKDATNSTWKTL